MSTIAFLGLGAMGRRMAARLVPHHDLVVYNRTAARRESLIAAGARWAPTPRQAVADADLVLSMLTDDAASRAVWLDPDAGALGGMSPGQRAMICSTVTPGWIRSLGAEADRSGIRLIDGPVVGSTPQAEAGALVFLLGGDATDVVEVQPILAHMGTTQIHVGARGRGAVMKLLVNGLFAVQVAAVAELLLMAEAQGLDATRALHLLQPLPVMAPAVGGAASLMMSGDHAPRFPVALVAKDLRYAEVAGAGPLVTAARVRYEEAIAAGHADDNLTAVHLL